MLNLGEYEFLRRLDDRLDEVVRAQRRHERLLIGIIDILADENADKAKAKALLAETLQRTEVLKAALATFPTLPPTQP